MAENLYANRALREAMVATAAGLDSGAGGPEARAELHALEARAVALPFGWTEARADALVAPGRAMGLVAGVVFAKVLGWLLTILAIGQGAPFWFDLLRRVGPIRASAAPRGTARPVAR